MVRLLKKSAFCFPSVLLPRGIESMWNPITLKRMDLLSAKVSFVGIYPADWKLPGDNQRVLSSVFKVTQITYIYFYLLTYMGVFGFGFEATYRPIRQLRYDKWHLGR